MTLEKFLKNKKQELTEKRTCYFRVKIIPKSVKNEFAELLESDEPTLKLRIAAPPEKGKANREICKFLGKKFDCKCDIISGSTTRTKLVQLMR